MLYYRRNSLLIFKSFSRKVFRNSQTRSFFKVTTSGALILEPAADLAEWLLKKVCNFRSSWNRRVRVFSVTGKEELLFFIRVSCAFRFCRAEKKLGIFRKLGLPIGLVGGWRTCRFYRSREFTRSCRKWEWHRDIHGFLQRSEISRIQKKSSLISFFYFCFERTLLYLIVPK